VLAAALAYVASGRDSLSHRQRFCRIFDVDTRLDVKVSDVMTRNWVEVPPNATLREFAPRYAVAARSRVLPIAEARQYIGMLRLSALGEVPSEEWEATAVEALMQVDYPVLEPQQRLRDAIYAMRDAQAERAAVLRGGRIIGTLQTSDVLQLEQILDTIGEEERRGLDS